MYKPHIQVVNPSEVTLCPSVEAGNHVGSTESTIGLSPLTLTALRITDQGWGEGWSLVPAPARRQWMDAQPYAYQCHPLLMANQWGWQLLCPARVVAHWDGSNDRNGLRVEADSAYSGSIKSQFGDGIITFSPPWLFRTPPGWDLLLIGPVNCWKVNCVPLGGVVETWWMPYTFTLNWKMIEPGRVEFSKGDPLGQLVPVPHDSFTHALAVEAPLESDPDTAIKMKNWQDERAKRAAESTTTHQYYRKAEGVPDHLHKIRVPAVRRSVKH
jgi:hypothetical protein